MIEKQLLSYLFQPGLYQARLLVALSPLHFQDQDHANLLMMAQQLEKDGYPVNLHTLLDKAGLDNHSPETQEKIREIYYTERDPDDFNFLLNEVEKLARKEHIKTHTTLMADIYNQIENGLDSEEAAQNLEEIWENYKYNTPDYQEQDNSAKSMVEAIKKSRNSQYTDLSFGLPKLDQYSSYVTESSLMIFAATPGSGKTAFAVWLANSYIKRNLKVAFVTAEMGKAELGDRFYAVHLQTHAINTAKHRLNQRQLTGSALEKYNETEEYFEKNQNLHVFEKSNIADIENTLKMHKLANGKPDVIFIDHLHHIKNNKRFNSPVEELSDTVRRIKFLAQELKTPIILMAQFNRQIQGLKEPTMHQLKGSSTIEEVANKIFILNRKKEDKMKLVNRFKPQTGDHVTIKLDKNREGLLGQTTVKFDMLSSTYFETEDPSEDED